MSVYDSFFRCTNDITFLSIILFSTRSSFVCDKSGNAGIFLYLKDVYVVPSHDYSTILVIQLPLLRFGIKVGQHLGCGTMSYINISLFNAVSYPKILDRHMSWVAWTWPFTIFTYLLRSVIVLPQDMLFDFLPCSSIKYSTHIAYGKYSLSPITSVSFVLFEFIFYLLALPWTMPVPIVIAPPVCPLMSGWTSSRGIDESVNLFQRVCSYHSGIVYCLCW